MAFHFPLNAILKLRRAQERAEELKLETILTRQRSLDARIAKIAEAEARIQNDRQERLLASANVAELEFLAVCASALVSTKQTLQRQFADIERERLVQLALLQHARQGREILESVRSQQRTEFEQVAGRREQQEHDDMFARRQLT
jgi:flagellar export protein FliJ